MRAVEIARFLKLPDDVTPPDKLFTPLVRPPPRAAPPERAALAVVERFFRQANEQALDLRRKRRFLDRSHELLLSLSVELGRDRSRAQALRTQVANERHRLAALERFVGTHENLPGAIKRAVDSQQGQEAYRGLLAVYRSALEGGHDALAAESRAAIEVLWGGLVELPEAALGHDAERRLSEKLGEGALGRLWRDGGKPASRDPLLEMAYDLAPEQWSIYDLAVTAGEFFDTGGIEEVEEGDGALAATPDPMRRVPFPTPNMTFDVAKSMTELRDFVISDPRLVLHNFASGTQLVRAYYEQPEQKPKKTRRSAVRVYVCDASGSMRGHRARFRDAVLIAELNNLSLRATKGKEVWSIYYSFFNDQPAPLKRIDSAEAAQEAIADLFEHSPARGRTDITYALESAFAAIHEARGRDPDLARATVVLITDGEDQIDIERIEAARHPVGDIEITLNFISLGEGHEDLRRLVLEQRHNGRKAFYSHLSDVELQAGASLNETSELRTLLPELPEIQVRSDDPAVRAAIEALEKAAQTLEGEVTTLKGPPPASRFEAYFPELETKTNSVRKKTRAASSEASQEETPDGSEAARASHSKPKSESHGHPDLERVLDIVGAVSEAVALAPPLERVGEAVELIEHLLSIYGLPLVRYRKVLDQLHPEVVQAVNRVRLLAGGYRTVLEEAVPKNSNDPAAKVITQPILPAVPRGGG
jgi:hypothetical protein